VATNGRPAAIERVRTVLDRGAYGQVGPAITSADVNARSNERLARLEQLADAGLLLTLVIAGCSLAVAVAGGLAERQRPFALLRLTGMQRSDLNRIVLAETAIPLLAIAAVSVLLGFGVSAALLPAAGHGSHLIWKAPPPAYWAALGGGLVLALLLIAATLPLLGRLTSAESARFE
jgi:predicted lysophospholipase L1 biosynthesis ABC-type transport system permease subunit